VLNIFPNPQMSVEFKNVLRL